jgi:AmiR/NasT family two-component response regulator
MCNHHVLIVGTSFFAEGIAQSLSASEAVTVVGMVPTVVEAKSAMEVTFPDVVIVTGTARESDAICVPLLASNANLTIIYVDISTRSMQVITSRYVPARTADLMEAIASLSRNGHKRLLPV